MDQLSTFFDNAEVRLGKILIERRNQWLFALGCTILTFICYLPEYYDLTKNSSWILDFVDKQIAEPFTQIEIEAWKHRAKRVFRLLVPILGFLLNISSRQIYFLEHLALIPFYWMIYKILWRYTNSSFSSFLLTISFVFTFFSKTFIFITPMFDAPALFLMVGVLYSKFGLVRFFFTVCIGFVDERGLVASSLLPLILYFEQTVGQEKKALKQLEGLLFQNRFLMEWMAAIGLVLALRLSLSYVYGFYLPTDGIEFETFRHNFRWIPFTISNTFQGFLLLFFSCFMIPFFLDRHSRLGSILLVVYLLGIVLMSSFVFDLTRSQIYGLPAIFFSVVLIRSYAPQFLHVLALITCFFCFITPDWFIITTKPEFRVWLSWFFPKILKFIP